MALADWTLSGATQEELLCSFGLVMRSELVYSFAAQNLCLALVSLDLSFGRAVSDEPPADNELGLFRRAKVQDSLSFFGVLSLHRETAFVNDEICLLATAFAE